MKIITSTCWDGRPRRGVIRRCLICKKRFFTPLHADKKLCSPTCVHLFQRRRKRLRCSHCNKLFDLPLKRLKTSKHGVFFCCRDHKDKAQIENSIWHNYKDGSRTFKRLAEKHLPIQCSCGFTFRPLLMVHHKDGDRKHNGLSNLEWVCAICHCIRHMRLFKGKWQFSSSALTPRRYVKRLMEFVFRGRGPIARRRSCKAKTRAHIPPAPPNSQTRG